VKTKPAKPRSPKTATLTPESAKSGKSAILESRQPVLRGVYQINVRPVGDIFQLFNRDEPCGDRLVKLDSDEAPFPLKPTSR
jgi:hypothetical protein